MKLSSLFISIMIVMTLTVTGCIKMGRNFDTSHIPSIKKEVTTQAEILEMFGKAASKGANDKGPFWIYSSSITNLLGQTRAKKLTVWFDDKNTVKDFSYQEGAVSAAELLSR